GVLERGCAEVDASAAGGEGRGQGLVIADPAGELDVHVHGGDHLGQQRGVAAAPEGGVEVDQVQPARTSLLEGEGGVQGCAVGGFGAGLALDESDGLAVLHVDGGEQL